MNQNISVPGNGHDTTKSFYLRILFVTCLAAALVISIVDPPGGQLLAQQVLMIALLALSVLQVKRAQSRLAGLKSAVVLAAFLSCNAVLTRAAATSPDDAFAVLRSPIVLVPLLGLLAEPLFRRRLPFALPGDWRDFINFIAAALGSALFYALYFRWWGDPAAAANLHAMTATTALVIMIGASRDETPLFRYWTVDELRFVMMLACIIHDPQDTLWPAAIGTAIGGGLGVILMRRARKKLA